MNFTRYTTGAMAHDVLGACRSSACAVLLVLLPYVACAQTAPAESSPAIAAGVAARFPAGSIRSVDDAEAALAQASRARAEVDRRFADEKNACLSRFFASSCVEDAKERRRKALEELKAVELEANAFNRRSRAAERDQALEEKRVQDEKDRRERAASERAPASQSGSQPAQSVRKQGAAAAQASDRKARHEEKLRKLQDEEAADTQKRADNIAAYEKKVQAAEARQKEIAQKKAEKERERAQKQVAPQ